MARRPDSAHYDAHARIMGIPEAAIALSAPILTSFNMLVIGCPPITIIAYDIGYFSLFDFITIAEPRAIVCLIIALLAASIYRPLTGHPAVVGDNVMA